MKKITQLTKNELIDLAQENKVDFEATTPKSELLGLLIQKLGPDFEVEEKDQPEKAMKTRILELAGEKKTAGQIARIMKEEGYHRIRKGYIYTILRQENLTVPKDQRVTISKEEYEALVKAAGKKK